MSSPVRTFDGPRWRFILTDLRTTRTLTVLTPIITEATVTRQLGDASPATGTVPADDPRVNTVYEGDTFDEPFLARNLRCLIGFRDTGVTPLWECAYTGIVHIVSDEVSNGIPVSKLSAWDLRYYLGFCPVVKPNGTLPRSSGRSFEGVRANVIARTLLEDLAGSDYGGLAGTLLDVSSGADEDCAELTITFEKGTSIAEAWSQLEQTGAIDIVLDPLYDPIGRPGMISVVNFKTEAGQDRNASIFSWDKSPRSLADLTRLEDGTKLANVIQLYDSAGGKGTLQTDSASVLKYGSYVMQQEFPGQEDTAAVTALAVEQLLLRKDGQVTVSVSPAVGRATQPIQDFDVGDRVPVYASNLLRKPIAAQARIYGIPFVIGDDSTERVDSLIVSADAVGA